MSSEHEFAVLKSIDPELMNEGVDACIEAFATWRIGWEATHGRRLEWYEGLMIVHNFHSGVAESIAGRGEASLTDSHQRSFAWTVISTARTAFFDHMMEVFQRIVPNAERDLPPLPLPLTLPDQKDRHL